MRTFIAGAATVGLEVVEDWPEVETIIVAVGGGGLVSGIALAVRELAPHVEVIGVEAAASPAFHEALKAGHIVEVNVQATLADGLAGNMDQETITFDLVRRLVDRMTLAPEPAITEAVRGLFTEERVICGGSRRRRRGGAACGLEPAGRNIAVVVSGSNIDADLLARVLRSG